MRPILYAHIVSPPVRSVLMLVKELKIDIEVVKIDLFKGDNQTPEFLKLNPMHTVPVLKHDDLVLTDSHSILTYLAERFDGPSNNNKLFGSSVQGRAEVMNKLMFNATFLFRRDSDLFRSIIHERESNLEGHRQKIHEAFGCLDTFLENREYVAGDRLTIADLSILATASTLDMIFPITEGKHPNVWRWFNALKRLPYYEETNQRGIDELKEFLSQFREMGKNE